jgi:hypothetical protein
MASNSHFDHDFSGDLNRKGLKYPCCWVVRNAVSLSDCQMSRLSHIHDARIYDTGMSARSKVIDFTIDSK